jgi:hypothetical protein
MTAHLWDISPGMMIESGQSHYEYATWKLFTNSSIWRAGGFEMPVTWVWVNSKGKTWRDFRKDKLNQVTMVWLCHAPLRTIDVTVYVKDNDELKIEQFLVNHGFINEPRKLYSLILEYDVHGEELSRELIGIFDTENKAIETARRKDIMTAYCAIYEKDVTPELSKKCIQEWFEKSQWDDATLSSFVISEEQLNPSLNTDDLSSSDSD